MEIPTHSFREKNLVLQLIYKSQIKSKTVMSWSSRRIKQGTFFTVYLSEGNYFKICDLSQCVVYWIQFPNLHTFTYKKTLLRIHFWLLLKSSKVFSVSLIHCGFLLPLNCGVDSNNFRIAKYAITFPQDREENDKFGNTGTVFNERSYVFKQQEKDEQKVVLPYSSQGKQIKIFVGTVLVGHQLAKFKMTYLDQSSDISLDFFRAV